MSEPVNSSFHGDEVTAYAAVAEAKPIPDAPYRGVEPFRFIDQQIFVARETETWNLISSIMIYRGVLLYGGSGTGKSSMINAGLIPQALKEHFLPNVLRVQPRLGNEIKIERIPIREDGKPPYLPSTFAKDDSQASFECSIQDVHRTLKSKTRSAPPESMIEYSTPPDVRPLLIFDQFEEFITLFEEATHARATNGDLQENSTKAQRAILEAVTDMIHDENLPIKILFVFREDYLGKLSILFENSPDLLDQYLRLLPPRAEKLQEIIRAPFKDEELSAAFAKGQRKAKGQELAKLADRIAAELREHSRRGGGGVNLSELQIVCRKLWESDKPAALIKKDNIIQTLIEEYWADALKKFPGELYEPAVALLGHMITSSVTRNIVSEDDLLTDEKPNFSEDLLRKGLEALVQSKLVRREPRYKLYFYEIVSEYLVPWIQRLKEEKLAELERVKTRESLERKETENRKLKNWRRALTIVSALMLISILVAFLIERKLEKHKAEAKAKLELTNQDLQTELGRRKAAEEQVNKAQRLFAILGNLPDPSADIRVKSVQDIVEFGKAENLPPGIAKLLPAIILTDQDERVKEAGRKLLPTLFQTTPELQTRAIIYVERADNGNQKQRADRIKIALLTNGLYVPDYQYGKPAPSNNQLRFCKISQSGRGPDEVLRILTDVDGEQWSKSLPCKNSINAAENYYEIFFASDKADVLKQLMEIERQWKDAKVHGDVDVFERIFADEFTNVDSAGNVYNKNEWIAALKGEHPLLADYSFEQQKLLYYDNNTATLSFILNQKKYGYRYSNIDAFVKRGDRWQVRSSQSKTLD